MLPEICFFLGFMKIFLGFMKFLMETAYVRQRHSYGTQVTSPFNGCQLMGVLLIGWNFATIIAFFSIVYFETKS